METDLKTLFTDPKKFKNDGALPKVPFLSLSTQTHAGVAFLIIRIATMSIFNHL
jgi:hypothetical protein